MTDPITEVFKGPAIIEPPIIKLSDEESLDSHVSGSNPKEGAARSTSNAAQGDKLIRENLRQPSFQVED